MKKLVKSNIALSEIILLILAIIAFAWMVQTEIEFVSADGNPDDLKCSDMLPCSVGQTCCADNDVKMTCKADGSGWENPERCSTQGENLICYGGQCITKPEDKETSENKGDGVTAGEVVGYAQTGINGVLMYDKVKHSETVNDLYGGIKNKIGGTKVTEGSVKATEEIAQAVANTAGEAGAAVTEVVGPYAGMTLEELQTLPPEIIKEMGIDIVQFGQEGISSLTTEQVAALSSEAKAELIANGWEITDSGTFALAEAGSIADVAVAALQYAAWASAVAIITQLLADKFSSQRNAGDLKTVAWATAATTTAVFSLWAAAAEFGWLGVAAGSNPAGWVAAIVVLVAVGTYMVTGYQTYSRQVYTYTIKLWQAPLGGSDCEKCNDLEIAGQNICSEYACKSYGTACEWINDETNYQTCTEVGRGDRSPPEISPIIKAYDKPVFPNEQYSYNPQGHSGIRILYEPRANEEITKEGCIPAFTSIQIAVGTDENAQCKISIQGNTESTPQEAFNNMFDMQEGSAYTKTHTLRIPASVTTSKLAQNSQGYELLNGGIYQFYIRCQDVRGNINNVDYVIGFCVDDGPDMILPEVIGASPPSDSYLPRGIQEIENFRVYTSEPADCKWDFEPRNYEYMLNEFENCPGMTPISGQNFGCQGTINGLTNEETTSIYVACEDQPWLEGTAKEDRRNIGPVKELIYKGSREIVIQDIRINGEINGSTIKDSQSPSKVTLNVLTLGGAEEGKAICMYKKAGSIYDYSVFYNNGETGYLNENQDELLLNQGEHRLEILCEDIAGNSAKSIINFNLEIDEEAPEIIRVYKEGDELKIITNEEATCYYSTFSCIYDIETDGIEMLTANEISHSTDWNTENDLFIKCVDKYGKRPNLDKCSLVVRPFEIPNVIEA